MSDIRKALEISREIEGKATEGPWTSRRGIYSPIVQLSNDEVWSPDISPQVWDCDDELDGCPEVARESMATATFIAHARNVHTALLDVVSAANQVDEYISTHFPNIQIGLLREKLSAFSLAVLKQEQGE